MKIKIFINFLKWADKSTTTYNIVDFENYIKNLTRKYLVIERNILKIQGILLQYLKFNYQIFTLQICYINFKI